MSSFEDIANQDLDDIRDVPPLPVGTYLCMVLGHHEIVKSSKMTEGMEWKLKFLSAREDVDSYALNEHAEALGKSLSDEEMKFTIWDSPYAKQAVRDFLRDTLGLSGAVKECLAQVPGQHLLVNITHRPSQDGKRLMANINSTARAS